jgi:gamma-glutamyltranspeptidase/glutathione hydrolase
VLMDAWRGDWLRQPDLARSLRRLAEYGAQDFYRGELAGSIVSQVQQAGGVLDRDDLASYAPTVGHAQHCRYRAYDVVMPGPASGAGVLAPMLQQLEAAEVSAMDPLGAERMGLLVSTSGRVWRQRLAREDDGCTSHFSVADVQGNVVACTTTLQVLLGSVFTVPGTGIVLNSAMALFDPRPGLPNSLEPGKKTITNMCPTIVLRDGRPRLSSGASGGRRIPSMLVQALTLALDHGFSIPESLRAPRFHHEGDMQLQIEEGLSQETLFELAAQGYQIDLKPPNGTALGGQAPALWFDDAGRLFGAPDPRRHGGAAAI